MTQAPTPDGAPLTPLQRAFLALEQARARVAQLEQAASEPIAVIGLGCRVPGADGPQEFWRLLRDEVDAIGPVPADRWDADALYDPDPEVPGRISTRQGGFLRSIDGFDPAFFGIAPREAQGMDPQQRLLLEVTWEALEHAAQAPDRLERSRTGVFIGACSGDYAYLQLQSGDTGLLDAHFTSGIAHSVLSGRLSYLLGLQGPSVTIDTACSSSLVAVHLACQSLRSGESRMALAGGVNLILSPDLAIALSHSRMLAPDGRCKTFDAAADGFARAEGCGMVVLKRLSDAQADGDRVLALIRGSAVNQDGPSSSLTAPNGPAQEAVVRAALAQAGLAPRQVGYIEAHGTGTQLGDPLEVHALGAVFGADRQASQPLVIGSVKTNIGHLEGAAGVTGLIKLVLSLQHRRIPAHLHFRTPSPHIAWGDGMLKVPAEAMDWPAIDGRRIGGVSSFGFSGTNAHVIVEEMLHARAPDGGPAEPALRQPLGLAPAVQRGAHLMALSAKSPAALAVLAARHAAALEGRRDDELADICHTANAGRAHFAHRAAIVAHSIAELRDGLQALAQGMEHAALRTAHVTRRDPPKAAFLFTGQGSQYAGMGRGLYEAAPVFREVLDRCAALLAPLLDRPLLELLFPAEGQPSPIDQTAYTQPALFALEVALAQLLRSWGVEPRAAIGHSVGEVAAACVAGVMSLEDGLKLIAERGRLMQSLPSGGAMAALQAEEAVVAAALARRPGAALAIAAVNMPRQTVVSGAADEVRALCDELAAQGVKSTPLTVSHAFHSPLVDPILGAFEQSLAGLRFARPQLRLVSNLTGGLADGDEITRPTYWRRHVREAVRFEAGARTLAEAAPDLLIELGPQPVLLGFVEAAFPSPDVVRVPTLRKGRDDWEQMLQALASLYLAGAPIDWRGVDQGLPCRIVDLPTYPFQRERFWFSAKPKQPAAHGRDTGHPLLGARWRSAGSETVFESRVAADQPGFVREHRVQGHVVMPATAYLDTLLAAAQAVFGHEQVAV
ncbi:MAG: type I polyketide synthase, partial [Pseudomonadota bacterium]